MVDYGQTRYALDHPDQFSESNPLIGNGPDAAKRLALVKLAAAGGLYLLADRVSHNNRTAVLSFALVFQTYVIGHNWMVGARVSF